LDHFVQHGMPMEELAVFNPGNEYESFEERAKSNRTLLIPRIIHIVWVDGIDTMPPPKRKIMELNKEKYPDYEYKVWSIHNVTRNKFKNYDRIHNLYNVEKRTRFSKRATMADVMRYEILYNEGGWYLDSGVMLFNRVLEQMRTYEFALSTERTFRHRWSQSMCMNGAMPKFWGFERKISSNNTNHYDIFTRDALEIAGNHDVRWAVRGMEEYNPNYLILDFDGFYPADYSLGHPFWSRCSPSRSWLQEGDEVVFEWKEKFIMKNCPHYYPFSYGKELGDFGGTWMRPKW
jgi:hypothetical protein